MSRINIHLDENNKSSNSIVLDGTNITDMVIGVKIKATANENQLAVVELTLSAPDTVVTFAE